MRMRHAEVRGSCAEDHAGSLGIFSAEFAVMMGKRVRKYYTLTTEGKSQVKERVSEFLDFIRTMGNVLQVELN